MAFWNKKKKVTKYKPTGKLGWFNMNGNSVYSSVGFNYSVIVEVIQTVNDRTKVKILEVDIHRNCSKSREACLKDYGRGDWVVTNQFRWETDLQHATRINSITQAEYEDVEELLNDDIDYTQHTVNPFVHTFINENE